MKTCPIILRGSVTTPPPWQCLVAENAWERTHGLLGREGLPAGTFLLLCPCNMIHTVGMKFPIDLVFTDRRGLVKKIVRRVKPGRIAWGGFATSRTFEAQAGWMPELPAGTLFEISGLAPRHPGQIPVVQP